MKSECDVAVIGGGTAGMIAAVQAARAGADTLLIEKTAMLGGTMTSGGVNFPSSFNAYDKQVVRGLPWELFCKVRREAGEPIPDFSDETDRSHRHYHLDIGLLTLLADEFVVESGAEILFHAMPVAVEETDASVRLTIATKTGLKDIVAKTVVDCTGDANVVALAGYETVNPEELQPLTYVYSFDGYDYDSLDLDAIQTAYEAALKTGELVFSDVAWSKNPASIRHQLKSGGGNANHIFDIDAKDSEGRTKAELEGRKAVLRYLRFLRKQPGLESVKVAYLAPECGVRETVVIKGLVTITTDDFTSGKKWPDAVCNAFYQLDLHVKTGDGFENGLNKTILPKGVVPTIPYRALLPKGARRIMVAGRTLSSDRMANSALRVEVPCMAMGQSAGAAASIAVKTGAELPDVPVQDILALLKQYDAILPE